MHVGVNGNPEIDFGRSVLFEMVRMFLEHGHALPDMRAPVVFHGVRLAGDREPVRVGTADRPVRA